MSKWEDKTNEEIMMEMKQLQVEHEAVKQKTVEFFDMLLTIEKTFSEANKALMDRLKNNGL